MSLSVYSLPGPEDCVETVRLNQSTPVVVFIPNGTVCFECVVGGVVDTDATFQIANANPDPSQGSVVNGTLVVFDSGAVFSTDIASAKSVRCMLNDSTNQALIVYESKFSIKCRNGSLTCTPTL